MQLLDAHKLTPEFIDTIYDEMMTYLDHKLNKDAYIITRYPDGLYERHILDLVYVIMSIDNKGLIPQSILDTVVSVMGTNLLDIIGDCYSVSSRRMIEQKILGTSKMTVGLYGGIVSPVLFNTELTGVQCIAIAMLLFVVARELPYKIHEDTNNTDIKLVDILRLLEFKNARVAAPVKFEHDIRTDPLQVSKWMLTYGIGDNNPDLTSDQLARSLANRFMYMGTVALYHYIKRGSPYPLLQESILNGSDSR